MSKCVPFTRLAVALIATLAFSSASCLNAQPGQAADDDGPPGGARQLTPGQPPVVIHPTVEGMGKYHAAHSSPFRSTKTKNLSYHGGSGGIGVETTPKIYLVLWGSQWGSDPSGEATILENFFNGIGGSSWLNSVTQYCQGVASGTVFCNGAGAAAGNPSAIYGGYFYDTSGAAPTHPTQSQLAAEAVNAAKFFGNNSAASNASVQYVIATAHNNNATGFGTQYCAWHSSTSSTVGTVAYTNLPYITDAGASCGANFNGLGPNAGITIVEGHELAETITDQFPSTGWLDSNGSENGDKCAWISAGQGASANVSFPSGSTFPVQSLWSNAFNNKAGGCVLSY